MVTAIVTINNAGYTPFYVGIVTYLYVFAVAAFWVGVIVFVISVINSINLYRTGIYTGSNCLYMDCL